MDIEVLKDFDGALAGAHHWKDATLYIEMAPEPPIFVDYAWHTYQSHFAFGLKNTTDREISPVILVTGEKDVNRDHPALIYSSPSLEQEFTKAGFPAFFDGLFRYKLLPTLAPGETLYLANTYFQPPKELFARLDGLARAGGAERRVFGKTVKGRDLTAYLYRELAPEHAPLVLITSGFHPAEPDTLATQSILEFLAGEEGRELRRKLRFAVAPVMNPDGFIHGRPASNLSGVNFYWEFTKDDPAKTPEAAALWKLALELKPSVYFDFHSYTFQFSKKASPYAKPLLFYRGEKVRALTRKLEAGLISFANGTAHRGEATWAPATMQYQLTRKLNTITFAKYHLALCDGVEGCREHGLGAVLTVCRDLIKAGITDEREILKAPHGRVKTNLADEIKERWFLFKNGPLRYRVRKLLGRYKIPPGVE